MTVSGESAGRVSLFLIDDSRAFLAELALLLRASERCFVAGTATSVMRATTDLARLTPNAILLDLQLPRVSGLESITRLREVAPNCRIIILSNFFDAYSISATLAAGADGYLPKGLPLAVLEKAVQEVVSGGLFVPSEGLRLLASECLSERPGAASLTAPERQMLAGLSRGDSNVDLARSMHVSLSTLKRQLARLFEKFGVKNRVELVGKASRQHLV